MSKSKLTDVEICRIHDLHKLGVPNTKIADELCVSERTIRYHLGRAAPTNATGVFRSLSTTETNRKDTIVEILDRQISYKTVQFGLN
jgi:IS30 family transposase